MQDDTNPIDPAVKASIEQQWRDRAKTQHWKPGTKTYAVEEVKFFAGAMATLQACFPGPDPTRLSPKVPPGWVICGLSGRPIVEPS